MSLYLSLIKNSKNKNGYSIHGLWVQQDEDTNLEYCKPVKFSMKKIKLLRSDLYKYWRPKHIKDPIKLWAHEWRKHGSCVFTDITQYEYFKKTLDLYKEVIDKNLNIKKYKRGRHYLIPVSKDFTLL